MGRGTKHKTDWKPTTLQTAIDARNLYTHTVKIIGNPKVFKPANDFHNVTLSQIHRTVLRIYMCVWKANRINAVLHPERADESWECARSCMEEGNSARLLRNMDNFVNELKGEIYADNKTI